MKEFITIEEVEGAYYDCRHNKRRKPSAVGYELNYELNNLKLWRELNEQTYEIGKSIAFCVTRPKLREVFAADFRDRIVHHIIMRKFMSLFESTMIDDSYNCRKGKGVQYGVRRVVQKIETISNDYREEAWILRCDLSGFFMSIDRDILWRMVKDLIRSRYHADDIDRWLWLIKKMIYNRPELNCEKRGDTNLWNALPDNKTLFKSNGKGLPIGNLTSQIFANFYMTVFDDFAISRLGDGYGRFVDDFVCISRDKKELLQFLSDARIFLREELRLTLHTRKVYLQEAKKGVKFTGSYIKPHRIYTENRTVSNAFQLVNDWNKDKDPDLDRYVSRMNSYIGFLVHTSSYGIRWRLWNKIEDKRNICCVNMKKLQIIKQEK